MLLGPQRLVISCLSFRCANPLAKIYYATFLWSNRRYSKLFRVSGFEPDPTSIVSLPAYLRAFRQAAFLRQAVLRVTGVAMTCYSPSTPTSPLMCAYLSRCVDEAFGTSSLKRRFVGLKIVRLPIPALTRGTVLALQCIRPSQLLRRHWVGQSLYTTLNGGQL